MNDLFRIFARLNIGTDVVLKAAGTTWNFPPCKPGLVGGHGIPADPYYLVRKAKEAGCHAQVIACAPLFLPMNYEESSQVAR